MSTRMFWTPKHFEIAIREIRRSASVKEACEKLAVRWNHKVSQQSLKEAFRVGKRGLASSYLPQNSIALKDSIEPPPRDTLPAPAPRIEAADARDEWPGDAPAPAPEEVDPVREYEERREMRAEKSREKELVERLQEATKRQAFLDEMSNGAIPILPRMQKTPGKREMCAVAMLSDLHVEEKVQAIEPFEEYNLEIAGRRLERLFQGVIDLVKHHRADGHYLIDYLLVWLGGDFMTGYLHEDNVRTSQLSPTETSMWLLPRLEGGLRAMLSELDLEHVEVPCSFGNHGRTTIKPLIAAAAENSFEWLLYHMLAERMKDEERVHFHITKSAYQYVSVYDWMLMFHHGDHVRYQGGILGPGVPFMKAVDAWNTTKHADYTHIGHLHTYGVFGCGVMNGSMIGHSPYSMFVKARKEDPAQAFYLLDAKRGMAMNTRLWVGESPTVVGS